MRLRMQCFGGRKEAVGAAALINKSVLIIVYHAAGVLSSRLGGYDMGYRIFCAIG